MQVSRVIVLVLALLNVASSLYDEVRHIESARLYGNIDAYAYYFVDLLVGTPPQRVSVILDTGSGLCAFPCAGCQHCGKHIDPNFDISLSSTAKWVKCGSGHCTYRQHYQEGSSISGYWFEDYVRLGDAIQKNPPVMAKMGCHQKENKLFYTQKANGIFGIQGSTNLLNTLFDDREHVEARIFSICLADWGGRFTVGGHNDTYHEGPIKYVPLQGTSYAIGLTGMKVDGQDIKGFRNTMLDSGSTYTYMGSFSYKQLVTSIEAFCNKNSLGDDKKCGKKSGKCWHLEGSDSDLARFPSVQVIFGSVNTMWEPREYLYRKGVDSKEWCYAFMDDGPNAPTVLGSSWMLYKEVIFDLKHHRLGIVKANCPQYKVRPEHAAPLGGLQRFMPLQNALDASGTNRTPHVFEWWSSILVVCVGALAIGLICRVLCKRGEETASPPGKNSTDEMGEIVGACSSVPAVVASTGVSPTTLGAPGGLEMEPCLTPSSNEERELLR